jgi:hypothetical protein
VLNPTTTLHRAPPSHSAQLSLRTLVTSSSPTPSHDPSPTLYTNTITQESNYMSKESSPVPRAGRRALVRQYPCDLLESSPSTTSSSSSDITYIPSQCASTSKTTLDDSISLSRVSIALGSVEDSLEMLLSSTPDDEACFVDFKQKQVGEFMLYLKKKAASSSDSLLSSQTSSRCCLLKLRHTFFPSYPATTMCSPAHWCLNRGIRFVTTLKFGGECSRIEQNMVGT